MNRWKSEKNINRGALEWLDYPQIDVNGLFGDRDALSVEEFTARLLEIGVSREDVLKMVIDFTYFPSFALALHIAGREVLYADELGDGYHGIGVVIYRHEDMYHVYVHEYGTCSGCDAFKQLTSEFNIPGIMDMINGAIGHTGETLASAISTAKNMGWTSAWWHDEDDAAEILAWLDTIPTEGDGA